MKTILITGSGGFVGKNLKEFLSIKYNLLTPRSFELDLCNKDAVEDYFKANSIDFIIHCSSKGGYRNLKDIDSTEIDNISMVNNILNFKKSDTRVILFGSGAMYSKDRPLCKVKEAEIGKFIPKDLYGKSKYEISKIVQKRSDVVCLNIFGCYGKYEKETRFPTYAIRQNLNKQKISINQNVVFDYLYIQDLCNIIQFFIENIPKNKILNVTPTKSISLYEISKIVNKIGGFNSEIEILNPILNNEYTGSNELLKEEIPNIKFTDYEIGLKELYNQIKKECK